MHESHRKLLLMAMATGLTATARRNCGLSAADLSTVPLVSRGKGRAPVSGRSNAASFKREAKKRRNMRRRLPK